MQFGDKIIFDCSYDQYMTRKEAQAAAKQLMFSYAENRQHKDPFDLHFCNVNYSGDTFTRLASNIPNLRAPDFPLNLHEGSYLDVFPKEKLVYLTPHCRDDLTEYDPEAIYIIGAMVDTKNHEPLSLIKAKELNLKIARLPLDRYLDWGHSSGKTLTLDQMIKIMLDLKMHRNWDAALKHVPRRKIATETLNERKDVRKWTANVNKFNPNFGNESYTFDRHLIGARDEQNTLSTAEKFKRKIGTPADSKLVTNKFTRNTESNFDYNRTEDRTVSTADKFKKSDRISSKNTKTRIDVKDMLKE